MLSTKPPVSIARQLHTSFRLISVAIVVALGIAVTALLVSIFVVGPELSRTIDVNNSDHDAQQAMLNQETGLRGYLFSGQRNFLEPYQVGVQELAHANAVVARDAAGSATLEAYLLPSRVAQQSWVSQWAQPAASAPPPRDLPSTLALLDRGKALFDAYRIPEAALSAEISADLAQARSAQYAVLGVAAALETLLFVVTLTVTARQHRRLRRDIVAPVDALLDTMRRVRDGDLGATTPSAGPTELRQIGTGLAEMTQTLAQERETRMARELDAIHNAERLQQILTLAREVAGSLNLRYVLRSVATSATVVSGWSAATVWLTDDEQNRLVAAYDTEGPDGAPMGIDPLTLGEGCAGKAAKYGRTASEGGEHVPAGRPAGMSRLALPMIVGAQVVGVLEVREPAARRADAAVVESLDALATHAGTAIEAARLHQQVEERSELDPLTQLFNRRRFEADLEAECSRSERYQRPLAFVMMDVDLFKTFNDEYGHQRGDEVLQEVANLLAGELREGDTAYRYGGEEFGILARETDAAGGMELAERIRARIANSLAAHGNRRGVTASFGVAGFGDRLNKPDRLVRAADAALYDAKREGRNRVVLSADSAGPPTMVPPVGPVPAAAAARRRPPHAARKPHSAAG